MKAENALFWIMALRRAEAKQGTEALGDSEIGYSCLGYGCKVLGIRYDAANWTSMELAKKVGLRNQYGLPAHITEDLYGLADMNDTGKSFKYIADALEKNPHEYFYEKVADELTKLIAGDMLVGVE